MNRIQVHKIREYTGHSGAIYTLSPALHPDRFLSCGSEGVVAEWDPETADARAVAQAPGAIFSMKLVPDRGWLLLGLQSGDLIFADLNSATTLRRVQLHGKSIFDFVLHPDGQHFFASSGDGSISLWNLDRMDFLHRQQVCPRSIRTLALSPDRHELYAGASDGRIYSFDLGLSQLRAKPAHMLSVFRILFAGERLFSTGRDAHLKSWDPTFAETSPRSVPAHTGAVNDLVLHPDGKHLFSGSMDKSIKLWRLEDLQLLKVVNFEKNACHWNGVNRLLWLNGQLYSCGDDRRIMQWDFAGLKVD